MNEDIRDLPIFPFLDEIATVFSREGLLLLSAETGAGKTTLLPWKLLEHAAFRQGKILLLEPRRLAARAAADRIASLLGEKLGQTVGLRTRIETLVSSKTRLEVVTEGVLTRMIQADPGLDGYSTILFDEFHTRSLQGDLGLALAWDARKILRPDLRLGLLSATLPIEAIRKVFGPLPLVEVPGRNHPVEVFYRPPISDREKPWEAAARLSLEALETLKKHNPGTVLCFLPGYREMYRAQEILSGKYPESQIFLLHGQMPPEKQHELLDPGHAAMSRVILSTNVAETSLTIPGVRAVADIGLERRVRFSSRTGMDHWETTAISLASAEQRKGRAGRTGPGVCFRWWKPSEVREPYSPPEILEADLAPLVLETALWGADAPQDLAWVTPLPEAGIRRATNLLKDLRLLDAAGKITVPGREAARFPVHPRLAKMALDAREAPLAGTAAVAAALLENEDILSRDDPDFRERLAAFRQWAQGGSSKAPGSLMKRIVEDARRILRLQGAAVDSAGKWAIDPAAAGRLLLSAYPDRAAKRTRLDDHVSSRWLLASGRGALLKGFLSQEEFLVALDLDGGETDARIFLAAPVERKDLEQGLAGTPVEHWILEWQGWKPKGRLELKVGALVLKEKNAVVPPPETLRTQALHRLHAQGLASLPWNPTAKRFLARCRFVEKWGQQPGWPEFAEVSLLEKAETWLMPFGEWNGSAVWNEQTLLTALENYLGWDFKRRLDNLAPESLALPSGSSKRLDYETSEVPVVSARLQEFFGCVTTPKISGQPLLLDLLSPAGRTVQRTRDLDGFWDRAYADVKKDLMGRYPRHYWPDNPREAEPTRRVKPKKH
jgi:ATP-dependent helicase HrpB